MKRPSRTRAIVGGACLALAGLTLAVWLIGSLCNDRWLWSQFLWWIPTAPTAATACVLIFSAWVTWQRPHSPRQRAMLCATAVATAAMLAWWIFGEYTVHRALRSAPQANAQSVTFVVWNPSTLSLSHVAERFAPLAPDVVLLANAPFAEPLDSMNELWGGTMSVARSWRLSVASRFPILRWGSVPLGVTGAKQRTFTWHGGGMTSIDQGEAMILELDTRERTGGTTLVWFVDLPSDPDIPRQRMMTQARAVLEAFQGPWFGPQAPGHMVHQAPPPVALRGVFNETPHEPDLIAGDTNTPGGSRSLRTLFGPARDCYTLAGHGGRASYPEATPLVAIDHAAVSPAWNCSAYEIVNLHAGKHRAQWLTISPTAPR